MPDTASTIGLAAMTVAIVALLIALGVLAVLVLVLVRGIHDEERHMSLTSAPRTRIGVPICWWTRSRRPASPRSQARRPRRRPQPKRRSTRR